jgi:stearoyl-CoA desaturase (delta-9 desaturase)
MHQACGTGRAGPEPWPSRPPNEDAACPPTCTNASFQAARPLRIALAVAGSLALQGGVISWMADHRHHAFSDKDGDPHSPWLFGTGVAAIARGFWHSHTGWLLRRDRTNARRFAPDLLAGRDVAAVDRLFIVPTVASLGLPALIGGLVTWSPWGAVTALFRVGLVRVALLHHVTWSINSICHMVGDRPFAVRDRSANVWWLAVLSFGESWHNLHHADPTCARHGVRRGQVDISARVVWAFEKLALRALAEAPPAGEAGALTRRQKLVTLRQ